MNKIVFFAPLTAACLLLSEQTLANGFGLNEQSVSSMGTSFAGRSSAALDASTVYGNPAGMSKLKEEQASFGFVLVVPDVDISNYSASNGAGPVSGRVNNDITPPTPIPFNYYVKPLNEKWHFGFGVFSPSGLGSNYDNDSAVRYLADKSELTVIHFQPSLSYAVTEDFSIGLGVIASYSENTMSARLPGTDGKLEISGDDWGFGYTIGFLYQITPQTRAGLVYRSKVEYDFNTKTKIRDLAPSLGPQNMDINGSLSSTMPESVDFSVTHEIDDRWTVYAGSTWTRWSRFKALTVNNPNSPSPLFETLSQPMNWHDSWSYALGASYQLTPELVLRAGVALDDSPAGSTQNVRFPIADRKSFSLGAGWKASDQITVDVAYAYVKQKDFTLVQQDEIGNSFQGDYAAAGHGFGMQLNYRF